MSRTFRVLLDEPLDADEGNTLDAHGSNMADADGGNSQTHMGAIVGADGGNMADANGRDLNSFKHPLNTNKKHFHHPTRLLPLRESGGGGAPLLGTRVFASAK
jgi:hypothetical protein